MRTKNIHNLKHDWSFSFSGTQIIFSGDACSIQVQGQRYQADSGEFRAGGKEQRRLNLSFSSLNLEMTVRISQTGNTAAVSGSLKNCGNKPVRIDQLWFGKNTADLGGMAEDYRIYYNSGCQEASGTCRFSDTKKYGNIISGKIDPDDPDTKTKIQRTNTGCIQPDHIYSHFLTTVFNPAGKSAVCIGSTSFFRAETVFFVRKGISRSSLTISPVILYNGLMLEPGENLDVERIGFYYHADPLAALERYADDVKREKRIRLKPMQDIPVHWNVWYAYTEEENNAGAAQKALAYLQKHLRRYHFGQITTGVIHRNNAFFETRSKPHVLGATIAEVLSRLHRKYPRLRMRAGCFWGAVSEGTEFFAKHPEAIIHDKNGNLCRRIPGADSWTRCPVPAYWIDFSHPSARKFFGDFLRALKPIGVGEFTLDFMGDFGEWRGSAGHASEDDNPYLNCVLHDPHMNRPFETDRVVPQMIRNILGPKVFIHPYTAPFFRYLGLADIVRVAGDTGRVEYGGKLLPVNKEYFKAVLKNFAANYVFHGRWWWNDADAICFGTKPVPERTEEFRIRSMKPFIVGGPITVGDKIPEMSPEQFHYYTINMPSTGYAARPLDLFEKEVPEIFHLPAHKTGFGHDLVSLINLADKPQKYKISLPRLGIERDWLIFEFWTKRLIEGKSETWSVEVPAFSGRHHSIMKKTGFPQVLGTDFHLSMGGVEIKELCWDRRKNRLSGEIYRPKNETGHVFVYLPEQFRNQRVRAKGGTIAVNDKILTLRMEILKTPLAWSMEFGG